MKDKIIKELATEIARTILSCPLNQGRNCDVCKFNDKDTISYDCQSYLVAEKLLEKYQPKIPEGAVVLTREEYEKLKNGEVTYNQMVRIVAEKFAERVKMAFYYEFDELIPSIMADKIDEICKEIMEGKV